MISQAARHRAMQAADQVDTHSIREAAVLGGVVRSIIGTGRCDVEYVARYARDIIGAFNLVGVDRSVPCSTEVNMVIERFEEVHGRPQAD